MEVPSKFKVKVENGDHFHELQKYFFQRGWSWYSSGTVYKKFDTRRPWMCFETQYGTKSKVLSTATETVSKNLSHMEDLSCVYSPGFSRQKYPDDFKILAKSPGHYEWIQEKAFELDYRWAGDGQKVLKRYEEWPYIFFSHGGSRLTHSSKEYGDKEKDYIDLSDHPDWQLPEQDPLENPQAILESARKTLEQTLSTFKFNF